MSKPLERSLEQLKRSLLALATIVEEQCHNAVLALHTGDTDLCDTVIDRDDEVDFMEVDIEEECLKLLALYQPFAFDLRLIIAILKINNDLERIGDLALNIAKRAKALSDYSLSGYTDEIEAMGRTVVVMVKLCLDALIRKDVTLAREVLSMDMKVDALHRGRYQETNDHIKTHPDKASMFISLLSVSRYLERIGDQATNIAEDVIYLVEGEIVRHQHFETQSDFPPSADI